MSIIYVYIYMFTAFSKYATNLCQRWGGLPPSSGLGPQKRFALARYTLTLIINLN